MSAEAVEIDGSHGEGGGQILRTSLALSVITGRPLRIKRIRAHRRQPGLQRQHLACVHAAARMCGAKVVGAAPDSQTLEFTPGTATPSEINIDIGSAGSATLVVQTVLVPAIALRRELRVTVTGGTHNPLAPPFEFLDRVFAPHLRAMGADVAMTLEKIGVMPKGGGKVIVDVRPSGPSAPLRPIELLHAGSVVARRAIAIIAGLPTHVAERELEVARERLHDPICEIRDVPRAGPANVFMVEVELATGAREVVTGFGEKGLRAELVAARALDELAAFVAHDVPVGEHLEDQLLLPMAVAGGGRFRCASPLSPHARTNIDTIKEFLRVPIEVTDDGAIVDVRLG
jgi:RNA 3'-terminal phosphate cyclase (ATP)